MNRRLLVSGIFILAVLLLFGCAGPSAPNGGNNTTAAGQGQPAGQGAPEAQGGAVIETGGGSASGTDSANKNLLAKGPIQCEWSNYIAGQGATTKMWMKNELRWRVEVAVTGVPDCPKLMWITNEPMAYYACEGKTWGETSCVWLIDETGQSHEVENPGVNANYTCMGDSEDTTCGYAVQTANGLLSGYQNFAPTSDSPLWLLMSCKPWTVDESRFEPQGKTCTMQQWIDELLAKGKAQEAAAAGSE